ncbi:MAG TPA: Tn7 transposase TnsA N-terminal domain-containing protein [Methylomirabilota bacterium]|nr:Tn7 transposase TnsA N-terminal domain-containing protein [Methylomirabilota bacterium]
MPVRNPLKQAGRNSFAVPTRKLDWEILMVHCDGPNERDYVNLLEYDPMVVSYEEQPCTIEYIFNQKKRLYTPDFAVYWRLQQPSLVECKPESKLTDPENLRKWTAARLWCEHHHHMFALVTDAALRKHSDLLSNIKLLAGLSEG